MATSETQQAQATDDDRSDYLAVPPETEEPGIADDLGDTWWDEFVQVEKVFSIISWIVIAGALAIYLGRWVAIYPITVIGIVVFSVGLVGIASLGYPIARIVVVAISDWRRQRSAKRARQV